MLELQEGWLVYDLTGHVEEDGESSRERGEETRRAEESRRLNEVELKNEERENVQK